MLLVFAALININTMNASEVENLTDEQEELKAQIDEVTDEIMAYQDEIDDLNSNIDSNNEKIAKLEEEQQKAIDSIELSKDELSETLVVLQKLDNSNTLTSYLFSKDDENYLSKLYNVKVVTDTVNEDITSFTDKVKTLQAQVEEVKKLQSSNSDIQSDIADELEKQYGVEGDLKEQLATVDSDLANVKVAETEDTEIIKDGEVTIIDNKDSEANESEASEPDSSETTSDTTSNTNSETTDNTDSDKDTSTDSDKDTSTDSDKDTSTDSDKDDNTEVEPETPKDTTKPTISGTSNVTITEGDSFNSMSGVSASDDTDGNLTNSIVVSGSVNTSTAGTYTLTYTVSDSSGNTASTSRTVTVKAKPVEPDTGGDTGSGGSDIIYSGNVSAYKNEIMSAAGISSGDYSYVDYIVTAESGWNSTISNPVSGAYGLCQALPGSKMASAGSDWATNAVTQMKWCDGYATSRYGSWASAYSFWVSNHWW